MSIAAAISFGDKVGFKLERGDIEFKAFGYIVTFFWNAHWSEDGLFIHNNDTNTGRHWTWVEIIHRLKFWRRGEVQWPAPTEEERRQWEALSKAAAANGEPWPPYK